jgi:hypothetical protein
MYVIYPGRKLILDAALFLAISVGFGVLIFMGAI